MDRYEMEWMQGSTNNQMKLTYTVNGLSPNASYTVSVNGKTISDMKASAAGSFVFNHKPQNNTDTIVIMKR